MPLTSPTASSAEGLLDWVVFPPLIHSSREVSRPMGTVNQTTPSAPTLPPPAQTTTQPQLAAQLFPLSFLSIPFPQPFLWLAVSCVSPHIHISKQLQNREGCW